MNSSDCVGVMGISILIHRKQTTQAAGKGRFLPLQCYHWLKMEGQHVEMGA
jgi:hypothetical protein